MQHWLYEWASPVVIIWLITDQSFLDQVINPFLNTQPVCFHTVDSVSIICLEFYLSSSYNAIAACICTLGFKVALLIVSLPCSVSLHGFHCRQTAHMNVDRLDQQWPRCSQQIALCRRWPRNGNIHGNWWKLSNEGLQAWNLVWLLSCGLLWLCPRVRPVVLSRMSVWSDLHVKWTSIAAMLIRCWFLFPFSSIDDILKWDAGGQSSTFKSNERPH